MSSNTQVGHAPPPSKSARVPSPDRTKAVSIPAFTPEAMSVYSLSPTMRAASAGKPARSNASRAMAGWGLPITRGLRPVARYSISHTLPQSGTEPYQVGTPSPGWWR